MTGPTWRITEPVGRRPVAMAVDPLGDIWITCADGSIWLSGESKWREFSPIPGSVRDLEQQREREVTP